MRASMTAERLRVRDNAGCRPPRICFAAEATEGWGSELSCAGGCCVPSERQALGGGFCTSRPLVDILPERVELAVGLRLPALPLPFPLAGQEHHPGMPGGAHGPQHAIHHL